METFFKLSNQFFWITGFYFTLRLFSTRDLTYDVFGVGSVNILIIIVTSFLFAVIPFERFFLTKIENRKG
jgi:hypothetical protein